MKSGTGLVEFSKRFPKRCFDVGIAEGHAVTFSAGLARNEAIPVFAVYSTFLQRSYDQILNDAAIAGEHIVLAVDRAGVVGEDGETHQGIFDAAFLNTIPNATVYSPSCFEELRLISGRRYMTCPAWPPYIPARLGAGRAEVLPAGLQDYTLFRQDGSEILLVTYGRIFANVRKAANI